MYELDARYVAGRRGRGRNQGPVRLAEQVAGEILGAVWKRGPELGQIVGGAHDAHSVAASSSAPGASLPQQSHPGRAPRAKISSFGRPGYRCSISSKKKSGF